MQRIPGYHSQTTGTLGDVKSNLSVASRHGWVEYRLVIDNQ
jgi:hypothetical protein